VSSRKYVQAFGAGDTVRFPSGRYFFVDSAPSGALTITTEGTPSAPAQFANIGAGSKFGPLPEGQGWRYLVVTSAGAQTIAITISDDGIFEVAANVTVAGTVSVQPVPAATTTNTAPVDAVTAAETLLIAANTSRRRVQIAADSGNADGGTTVDHGGLIRAQSGGQAIDELQPGTAKWFDVTHGLWVRNDSGSTNRFYVREEIP
jgi:hypothetical protein